VDGVSCAQRMGLEAHTRLVDDGLRERDHLLALRKVDGDTVGEPLGLGLRQ
jgi:hypothetical protein